jgi:SAM-dependent methyltransferase
MAGPRRVWLFTCPGCGFLAAEAASGEAASGILDEGARAKALEPLRRRNFETVLDRLGAWGHPPAPGSRLLDVGCAHGWFLDAAAHRGHEVTGLEPDAPVGSLAAGRGHRVLAGRFPEALPPGETWDVVSFLDVFEHLPDPGSAAEACTSILRPGGALVLVLPSSRGTFFRLATFLDRLGVRGPHERMWQHGFPSPHLGYFHPANLAALLGRHGLREVHRESLPSVSMRGLWQRLRYDTKSSLAPSVLVFAGVVLSIPLLAVLPSDIVLLLFEKPPGHGRAQRISASS